MVNVAILESVTAVFMAVTIYLGWYGYRSTKDNGQFLLGKNKANPILIALSYGATFISTSAIVGFGGMAARYGLSIVWLAVLCILVGTILAFLVFGKRTRRIGNSLGAFTFADFLGKRFKSGWIRTVVALIILVGMPIYCAAVLIGGVNLIAVTMGLDKNVALLGLSLIVAMYVTFGGVIAVMYNYALQAGFSSAQDAIALEDAESEAAQTFANIIVVKEGNEQNPAVLALVEALKSDAVRDYINSTFDGNVLPIF